MKTSVRRLLAKSVLTAVMLLGTVQVLLANTSSIPALRSMDLVGEARMQVLFWNVYDAELYAPGGRWSETGPFALSLTYLRDLPGEKIAERSIQEIRKQGFADERTLARWYDTLLSIIPDVSDKSEIIGVADANVHTQFYLNGELIGQVAEPEFTRAFFAIWLGDKTSEPRLRAQLLGADS